MKLGMFSLPQRRRRCLWNCRQKRLPAGDKKRLSRSLSHSDMTAAQYYRANTEKDCDTAFEAVQSILDGEAGPSPPPLTPITSTPK